MTGFKRISAAIAKVLPAAFAVLSAGCRAGAQPTNTSYIYPPWQHTWGVVRATPFKLRLFVGDKTHFNDPQGLACVRLTAWEDPTRESDDDEITAYGVNSGDNCLIYNRSMYSLGIYGLEPGHYRFNQPWGIAANSRGDVYVADRRNARVVRLFNPGKDLTLVGTLGGSGDGPGEFLDPRGVALDSQGNLYVTDAALGRVTVFDDRGRVCDVWEGFEGPDAVAVVDEGEPWSYFRPDRFAVVVDSLHQRLSKVSLDGKVIRRVTVREWGADGAFLAYLALDYYNQVLVTDRNRGCIHKLDRDLNYLTSFGTPGKDDYQFDQPRGIAVNRRFGQILVAEREGAQYLWVAVDVKDFRARVVADSIWRDLRVDFSLSEPAFAEMDVQDRFGRFLTRLTSRRFYPAGAGHLAWNLQLPSVLPDGKPAEAPPPTYRLGQPLPTGEYVLLARFRATYSSREHYFREVRAPFTVY